MSLLNLIPSSPPGEGVIALLEQALIEAKAGEISSIAIASVDRDGVAHARWSFAPSISTLIGAVSKLSHRLNMEADG